MLKRTDLLRVARRAERSWPALVFALGLGGCSLVIDADTSRLGALPQPCERGQTASCPCPDGTRSTQVCNDLARYDACACQGHGAPLAAGSGGAGGTAGTRAAGSGGK